MQALSILTHDARMPSTHRYFLRIKGRQQEKLYSEEEVLQLVETGALGEDDAILLKGMPAYRRIGDVPKLANRLRIRALEMKDPLGLDELPTHDGHVAPPPIRPQPPTGTSEDPADLLRPVAIPSVMALSVLTATIYGIVWFHSTGLRYKRLADPDGPSLHGRLWTYLGVAIPLSWTGVGVVLPLWIIPGAVYLKTFLKYRDALLAGLPVSTPPKVASSSSLILGWCCSMAAPSLGVDLAALLVISGDGRASASSAFALGASLALFGLFGYIQIALQIMRDHNRIVAAARAAD